MMTTDLTRVSRSKKAFCVQIGGMKEFFIFTCETDTLRKHILYIRMKFENK